MDFGADFRFGGDLTLVDAGVTVLHVFDLQHPFGGRILEVRLKPFVSDKCGSGMEWGGGGG